MQGREEIRVPLQRVSLAFKSASTFVEDDTRSHRPLGGDPGTEREHGHLQQQAVQLDQALFVVAAAGARRMWQVYVLCR